MRSVQGRHAARTWNIRLMASNAARVEIVTVGSMQAPAGSSQAAGAAISEAAWLVASAAGGISAGGSPPSSGGDAARSNGVGRAASGPGAEPWPVLPCESPAGAGAPAGAESQVWHPCPASLSAAGAGRHRARSSSKLSSSPAGGWTAAARCGAGVGTAGPTGAEDTALMCAQEQACQAGRARTVWTL